MSFKLNVSNNVLLRVGMLPLLDNTEVTDSINIEEPPFIDMISETASEINSDDFANNYASSNIIIDAEVESSIEEPHDGDDDNDELIDFVEEPVEEKAKLDNSTIIRNISTDQSEILWNIMQLYNDGNPYDCDMTASELKFYRKTKGSEYEIPEPKILFDVFPKEDKIKKIEPLGRLPLEDNSIHSIVIDLPFVVSPPNAPSAVSKKEGASLIFNRFYGYYPVDNLYESYYHWISEAYRVLDENGICVFKTQSTVSGGVQHNVEEWSYLSAQKVGFTGEDKFILQAKARLISPTKYKKQYLQGDPEIGRV